MFHSLTFKIKCVFDIKPNVQTPEQGYFINNMSSNMPNIRLCWVVQDQKFYRLLFKLPAAKFLTENGIVDYYEVDKAGNKVTDVRIYRNSFHRHKQIDGDFAGCWVGKQIAWEDIKLTRSDVQLFGARAEYRRCIKGKPLPHNAKVIQMFPTTHTKKSA